MTSDRGVIVVGEGGTFNGANIGKVIEKIGVGVCLGKVLKDVLIFCWGVGKGEDKEFSRVGGGEVGEKSFLPTKNFLFAILLVSFFVSLAPGGVEVPFGDLGFILARLVHRLGVFFLQG